MQSTMHAYEVLPRKDYRGVDLISDVLLISVGWGTGRIRSVVVFDAMGPFAGAEIVFCTSTGRAVVVRWRWRLYFLFDRH